MRNALLLEDDRIFRIVFENILKRNNFNVISFVSPIFVFSTEISLTKFDLIITDNEMPYMKGIDFLKYIKDYSLTDQRICFNSSDYEITCKAKNEGLCQFNIRKSPVDLELFLNDYFK